jgi:hypothetical protein
MSLTVGTQRALLGGSKLPPLDFNPDLVTFTPGMAKRTAPGPFATAPIIQGKWDGTAGSDLVTHVVGSQIGNTNGYFYANIDETSGTIVCWITPEWAGNDGINHAIYREASAGRVALVKVTANRLDLIVGGQTCVGPSTAAWTAGTTYCIIARWSSVATLDGTNYACVSVDDAHTYGMTTAPTLGSMTEFGIGSSSLLTLHADSIIEGLTVYRRPLWDGTYGTDVGNGDEINLIWAAGAGKDPCLITGSWDVVFCLPTNSTAEELTTGTGEAWSHPHSSNQAEHGWFEDGGYLCEPWAVALNGTTTYISCGSGATLDDLPDAEMTLGMWVRTDGEGETNYARILNKQTTGAGWEVYKRAGGGLAVGITCLTVNAVSTISSSLFPIDGKWHYVTVYFNDAGDRKAYIAIDGVWASSYDTQTAGVGAYQSDAARSLILGNNAAATLSYDTGLGRSLERRPPFCRDRLRTSQNRSYSRRQPGRVLAHGRRDRRDRCSRSHHSRQRRYDL